MAHKTMIDGVAYEISGGKTLVNGTAYSIKNGKTLVGGTVYAVGFGGGEATLTVDIGSVDTNGYGVTVTVNAPFPNNSMSAMMGMANEPPVALTGGMSGSWSYPVPVGTVIEFSSYHSVYLNGTQVSISTYVVTGDVTIKTINQNQRRIYITEQ